MNLISKPCSSVSFGLHSGAASGNLGLVKFALDSGQSIESCVKGLLPIHTACAYGHVQVVRYLLERGANVNARRRPRRHSGNQTNNKITESGSTALHFAAANGQVELVLLLLQWGAKIDVVDKYGSTPHNIAVAKQNFEVATLLEIKLNNVCKKISTSSLQNCTDIKPELTSPPNLSSGSTSSTISLLDKNSDDEKSYTDTEYESEYPLKEKCRKSSLVNLPVFPRSKSVSDLRSDLKERSSSIEVKDKSNLRRFFPMYNKSPLQASYIK